MEEINLKELFDYMLNKILITVISVVACFVIGFGYMKFIQTPLYKGETTLILVKANNQEGTITQNDILLNQNLVGTYSEIIKSKRVLNKVITELELDTTVNDLAKSITVESVTDTEIIKISVSNRDNKQAVKIANRIAKVFSSEIVNIYNMENVTVVDKAVISEEPYNVSVFKQLVLYILVGLVLGVGVEFVMFYFDTTIKSNAQIENLGLTVFGNVPEMEGEDENEK